MIRYKNKIGAVFLIALFVFSITNFSIAENIKKTEEKISIVIIPDDISLSNVDLYSNPIVFITDPQNGDIINIPYLEVVGYAQDPVGLDYIRWTWESATSYFTNESQLEVSSYYTFRIRVYNLQPGWHKVTVKFCNTEDNCSSDVVTVTYVENDPPTKPGRPYGPDRGVTNTEYNFSTHSTDPDGDTIRYGWDWDGDNVVDEWTDYYPSGETIELSHNWSIQGTYQIKVMAEDYKGGESDLSSPLAIVINDNTAPFKPATPTGSSLGEPGRSYSYSSSTTDPNGDRIYYMFDWDDGTELEWIGPYNSGDTISVSHIWNSKGSYSIKVKAKDDPNGDGDLSDGEESVWSNPLAVNMPKTKSNLLRSLIENFYILKNFFSIFYSGF